jgi:beta-alanine--pyruvate transaminase
MVNAFAEQDLVVRATGDTIALTPPLIVSEAEIGQIVGKVAAAIRAVS